MAQCCTGSTQEGRKTSHMSEKLLTGTACVDPGIFARGVQAGLLENGSDNVFIVLNLFYSFTVVYQWFNSKKTIISQGFRGGPTFSRGSNFFLNANLYRNP